MDSAVIPNSPALEIHFVIVFSVISFLLMRSATSCLPQEAKVTICRITGLPYWVFELDARKLHQGTDADAAVNSSLIG